MLIQLMVNTFVSFSNDAVVRCSFVVRGFDGLLDRPIELFGITKAVVYAILSANWQRVSSLTI